MAVDQPPRPDGYEHGGGVEDVLARGAPMHPRRRALREVVAELGDQRDHRVPARPGPLTEYGRVQGEGGDFVLDLRRRAGQPVGEGPGGGDRHRAAHARTFSPIHAWKASRSRLTASHAT